LTFYETTKEEWWLVANYECSQISATLSGMARILKIGKFGRMELI
jgi:hypothetical protein